MIIVQKVETTHDTNGNPRRGWLVYQHVGAVIGAGQAQYLRFVDEGYAGTQALRFELAGTIVATEYGTERNSQEWLDANVVELGTLRVTPSQYNALKRDRSTGPRA